MKISEVVIRPGNVRELAEIVYRGYTEESARDQNREITFILKGSDGTQYESENMDLIYLDYNCFQRGFDDPRQMRIQRVGPEQEILSLAQSFQKQGELSAKDAIHLACAVYIGADFFLTCDDTLITRARRLELRTEVMNPIAYIMREVD